MSITVIVYESAEARNSVLSVAGIRAVSKIGTVPGIRATTNARNTVFSVAGIGIVSCDRKFGEAFCTIKLTV